MNRTILMLAMVAVACAIIVACGQRNQLNHEIQPTSGGEGIGIDHGTIDVNSLPTVETTIEHERFTAAMPQGWQLVQTNNDGVNLLKGTIDEDVIEGPYMVVSVHQCEGTTAEGRISELVNGSHAIDGDEVTIVGRTYKTCTFTEDGYDHLALVRDQDGWLIAFYIINTTAADPEVRAIIHSLRLK